ncbi:MAG: DUF4173 domain-containing protein [Candidatus Magasanikbacteria bacterium]|jgi:hypothetical protein|nr:DUF4173 domain-containing protein [Candidatus Magasanikbacteria bacterium]MBT4221047.1 DUF4173 domain-containing protein [Candidatus Magasanikbacteria bacterium]MBT4350609.1 DUF4173 domain-containing protein [Candidatus Magasanikbacteria bacterium]MBT4542092.1 DUF4173 domain-containing protein [Candidatus Magasanikbacteria bacterium]MBT6253608.1 DUF4173 domain-containing protein [Candidatus Magasanikbacteria bacterium]
MNKLVGTQPKERWHRLLFITFGLGIGIVYDIFFWEKEIGINFLFFILVYLVGFTIITLALKKFRQPWALTLLIPICIMGVSVVTLNNELRSGGIPVFILILSVLYTAFLPLQNPQKYLFSLSKIPLFSDIDLLFRKWWLMIKDVFIWKQDMNKDILRKILLGFVIAVPILGLFTWLFSKADPIFAEWVQKLVFVDVDLELAWRVFRTGIITLWLGGLFYVVVAKEYVLEKKNEKVRKIDGVIAGIVLGLVNVLFLAFVAVQFRHLFGTSDFVLENGLTFAEYARKGFFELVWVIIFAAILLLISYRAFVRHGSHKVINVLQTLLIIQVGVVAASALKRMNLYQDAFGFTVLRLYVEWFIYLVFLLLVFSGASLIGKLSFRKFFHSSLILGAVALSIVSAINVDRVIAEKNVYRFTEEGKELDLRYLSRLSVDVIPELDSLFEEGRIEDLSLKDKMSLQRILDEGKKYIEKREKTVEFHMAIEKIKASALLKEENQQRIVVTDKDLEKEETL